MVGKSRIEWSALSGIIRIQFADPSEVVLGIGWQIAGELKIKKVEKSEIKTYLE